MAKSLTRSHVLVLPLLILVTVLLEELVEYQLRIHVESVYQRALATMVLVTAGFTLAFDRLTPWLKALLLKLRTSSRRRAGRLGVWFFFCLAYGALFLAYVTLQREGAAGLLPPAWR